MRALDFGFSPFSYYSFAAAYASQGPRVAANCARAYGLTLGQCLQYLRRYAREGYSV